MAPHTARRRFRSGSRDLHHSGNACSAEGWRLPAREIEPLVRARIVALLNDPIELFARSNVEMPSPDALKAIVGRGKDAATALAGRRAPATKLLRDLIAEIRLGAEQVSILLNPIALGRLLGVSIANEAIKLNVNARLKRSGYVMRLIQQNGSAAAPNVDRTLAKAIVQGRSWWQELQANTDMTVEDLARREGITGPYVARRLAFLPPQTLASVIDGTLPPYLTVKRLTAPGAVAARWDRPNF